MFNQQEIIAVLIGATIGWLTATGDKAQHVRIFDVTLVGPLMILIGVHQPQPKALHLALAAFGGATVTYNLRNYLVTQGII